MASTAKVMHGARAIFRVEGQVVGIATGINFTVAYDVQPVTILGRFGPAELAYVGAEAVTGTISGWRVVGHGPFASTLKVPRLNDLLNHSDLTISVIDRQTGDNVGVVVGVRYGGFSTGFQGKQLSDISIPFSGLYYMDESGGGDEASEAVLP